MPSSAFYNDFKRRLFDNFVNGCTAATAIKVMLVNGYTPNVNTDIYQTAVTGEVTGTGYTAGGYTLANLSITTDNTNARGVLDNTVDPSWTGATLSATGAVVYKYTGTLSTSPLMAYIDFGGTIAVTAGTLTDILNASGLFTIT